MTPPAPNSIPRSIEQMAEQACAEYSLDKEKWKPILQDVIKYGLICQRMRMGLSPNGQSIGEPNRAYDYVQARSRLLRGIQEFVQKNVKGGLRFGAHAVGPDKALLGQNWPGESIETGPIEVNYSFTSPDGRRLPDILIRIDHVSTWHVTVDVMALGRRKLIAQNEAWEWRKILDAIERSLTEIHREFAALNPSTDVLFE